MIKAQGNQQIKLFYPIPLIMFFALVLVSFSTTVVANSLLTTNVPDVAEYHLGANYWQQKLVQADKVLLTPKQINKFNQQLVTTSPHINAPLSGPATLDKETLVARVKKISKIPSSERYYGNGAKVLPADYKKYQQNLHLSAIQEVNRVQFALVVRRSALRTFPTLDRIFKKSDTNTIDQDLDLFQESGIFPGEAVSILHKSLDANWYLVQSYNYLAWMPAADVAIGNKKQITDFITAKSSLVITGDKVFTNAVPSYIDNSPAISNIQLDMGVRLPLASPEQYGDDLYGQNPYGVYVVQYPVRDPGGQLLITLASIAKSQDVSIGYLPFTQANLVKQAFKFLGERYGWGHDFNGRDCTGFIGEIFKSFGILMPRNSGQQAKGSYGDNIRFEPFADIKTKQRALNELELGDLIYMPGHVMMYLGQDNNQAYIIHDVKELNYLNAKDEEVHGTLNAVSVTPLLPLKDYLNNITSIKRLTGL